MFQRGPFFGFFGVSGSTGEDADGLSSSARDLFRLGESFAGEFDLQNVA